MEGLDRYNEAEYTANKYVLRCTCIMTMAIVVVWIINILDIFIINDSIVSKTMLSSLLVYALGRLLFFKTGIRKPWVKYIIMIWAVSIVTIIVTFLTYQTVIGTLIPMIYAGMYCNKKCRFIRIY